MEQRPAAVPIVAAFLFAAAAIAAVVAASFLFPGTLLDWLWALNKPGAAAFRALGKISGPLLLLLGAAAFAAAFGLLQRRKWAWWLAVVLFAADAFGDLVSLALTGDWLRSASGALISSVFLYSLSRYPVRRYCKHERQRQ
jgi:hypothetical protein